ncbi:hypothetical protein E2C01_022026 [Portunus trituberculatus]|uniref:Uncharacterized protein n=1 Tax=Portunus trituberculatus TaxID=210409 RepID=A0A5B7E7T9_PORTR|nr:hypothetical protein [Portunus trituberculatus]
MKVDEEENIPRSRKDELCFGVRTITNAVNRLHAALHDQLTACWGTMLPQCLRNYHQNTLAATFSAKPILVLSPVPTAVPPAASMYRRGRVAFTRSMPNAICWAYPPNSWPRNFHYLSVGSTNLDNVCKLLGFVIQSLMKSYQARQKSIVNLYSSGNVHGCRLATNNFICCFRDGIRNLRIKAKLLVDLCRCLLQDTKSLDHSLGVSYTDSQSLVSASQNTKSTMMKLVALLTSKESYACVRVLVSMQPL